MLRTNLLILEKDMERKKDKRQTKQVSEDFALNKVHQMVSCLLISLHDEVKITSLMFNFTDEQKRVSGGAKQTRRSNWRS